MVVTRICRKRSLEKFLKGSAGFLNNFVRKWYCVEILTMPLLNVQQVFEQADL